MGAEITNVSGHLLTLRVSGTWDGFSFQSGHGVHIERMAIAGDRKWEELALLFTAKGLRAFPMQYFSLAQIATARAWIVAN